jgi:uncharacterized membrane protein YtjA (UPF0391 family)
MILWPPYVRLGGCSHPYAVAECLAQFRPAGTRVPSCPLLRPTPRGVNPMLGWALTFLVLALVAGLLGFFALAGVAAMIAKVLLLVFLVLLVVSFFTGGGWRRSPPVSPQPSSGKSGRSPSGRTFCWLKGGATACRRFFDFFWNRLGGIPLSPASGRPVRYAPAPSTPRIGCPLIPPKRLRALFLLRHWPAELAAARIRS